MSEATEKKRGLRKQRTGVVVSNKGDKTIVVQVTRRAAHPLYKKVISLTKKFHAHDETNDANIGDTVTIVETRPLSKLKRWRMTAVVRRAVED
ncbi:MAG TPA: 30S ribosomal protein S17 [Lentisphaeria bacterium]|nr:30S ribosomal protein S17 [Lentisphaeria bacterium]